jgi:hypothetical protein
MIRFIIFIFLLSVCSIGYGQDDSILFRPIGTYETKDTIYFNAVSSTQSKQDTIPVIILIADTSNSKVYRLEGAVIYGGNLWWQFGYEVYERTPSCDKCLYQSIFIGYIDQNKKQLPSSIIVWMSKEIKN